MKIKILIADDEKEFVETLAQRLEMRDFSVTTVCSGEGATPNAIAYDSKQFTTGEFFAYGIPASFLLMIIIAVAVLVVWPLMGMPVLLNP